MREQLERKDMKLRLAIALLDHAFKMLRIFQPMANIPAIDKERDLEGVIEKLTSEGIQFESIIELSQLWGLYNALMVLPLGQSLRKNWTANNLFRDNIAKWRPTVPEIFDRLVIWSKTMKKVVDGWDDGEFELLPEVAEVFETALAA